jgi:fructose-bisphosphate aldolase, class I
MNIDKITELLGKDADSLLGFDSPKISRDHLSLPGPNWVDNVFSITDRPVAVLRNMQTLFNTGNLGGKGYLSILPVDQGVEHSGGSAFSPNPIYFDPENIVKLAIEGGCNAVASTSGILSSVARKYAHKIPFILKLNHNELLSYPNTFDQVLFSSVKQAFDMGAVAVGATIYFGSPESPRQIEEISAAFEAAHDLGMVTILWCYVRNNAFKIDGVDHNSSSDLTGQANYLGATIQADIVKQKQPVSDGGYLAMNKDEKFGKYSDLMYDKMNSLHPIDMTRYQVVNNFMGRVGLINSGGASGKNDLAQAVKTAVINKRAGGMGLISGRKSFQKPMNEGVELLNAIQSVYSCKDITVA